MDALPDPALRWSVVVPVKSLARAKSRLSTRPAAERVDLARAFALDVVTACLATPAVARMLVVTDDAQIAALVRPLGAHVRSDPTERGGRSELNAAALEGVRSAVTQDPDLAVAILAADLPAMRPTALSLALGSAAGFTSAFVSDSAGIGTTMLTGSPAHLPVPQFGGRSRAAHTAAGSVEITGPGLSGLRCDVDTEVDLWHALALGVGPHTSEVLDRIAEQGR